MSQVSPLVARKPAKKDARLVAFGRRLRELREAAGLTQSELADRTSLHRITVTRLEGGLIDPSLTTVQKLAESLGVLPGSLTDSPS